MGWRKLIDEASEANALLDSQIAEFIGCGDQCVRWGAILVKGRLDQGSMNARASPLLLVFLAPWSLLSDSSGISESIPSGDAVSPPPGCTSATRLEANDFLTPTGALDLMGLQRNGREGAVDLTGSEVHMNVDPNHQGSLIVSNMSSQEEYEDLLWWDGFQGSLVEDRVLAVAVYNGDVIAGGYFQSAGGVPGTTYIARWDGTSWNAMGNGEVNDEVEALAVYQGNLYAGGGFRTSGGAPSGSILRWDGSRWNGLPQRGLNSTVRALLVYGTDLIVAGGFTQVNEGIPVSHVARWNGTSWDSLGAGLGSGFSDPVLALTEHNGSLIAGGGFTTAGGTPVNHIARWNGSSWVPLGSGTNGSVWALTSYQQFLVAGGSFTMAGSTPGTAYLAQWDGTSWQPVGGGVNYEVYALAKQGGNLIAGGYFWTAGGIPASGIARWDGTSWSSVGTGITACCGLAQVEEVFVQGDSLFVGGVFGEAGSEEAFNIAVWDGASWHGEMSQSGEGLSGSGRAMVPYNGSLVVGGTFIWAGKKKVWAIAQWDGTSWYGLGSGMNGMVAALAVYGTDLIAGGYFTNAGGVSANYIARWDGTAWYPLGTGMNAPVDALVVHNGALYVGGRFSQAGGQPANLIAKWDGSSWSALGPGLGPSYARVEALTVYDNALVAGGDFETASGLPAKAVARWDGVSWNGLGGGMAAFDNGGFPYTPLIWGLENYEGSLVAVGTFTIAGGTPAKYAARWNGAVWDSMGTPGSVVFSITAHQGSLFLGRGYPACVMFWNGHAWDALGSGFYPSWAYALTSYAGSLYATGLFQIAGNNPSIYIGMWTANRTGIREGDKAPALKVHPNPVRSQTRVVYQLEESGLVRLAVYDVEGRRVAVLFEGSQGQGQHTGVWNGFDERGKRLRSGLYYLEFKSKSHTIVQKLVLIP